MTRLLMLAVALGLDSFQVSAGLAMAARDSSRDWQLASAFAISDAFALLLGLLAGDALSPLVGEWAATAGPLLLAAYALYVVRIAWHSEDVRVTGRWVFVGLPLALSLDNLMAGAVLATLGFPATVCALTIGGVSGGLSLLGLRLGGSVRPLLGGRCQLAGGALLLVTALSLGLSHP
jgi:manganese efflux pump family protein